MEAVLGRALEDLDKPEPLPRYARQWMMEDNPAHLFSFVTICSELGLDPDAVRRAVSAGYRGDMRRYAGTVVKCGL